MDVIQECMEMISFGGDAKSLALLAIKQSREGKHEEAAATMEKAEESLAKSHQAHTNLLSYDAKNQDLQVTIFMVRRRPSKCRGDCFCACQGTDFVT